MEHRTTVLLFETGYWLWSEDYHLAAHKDLGRYEEIYFAKGWQDSEVEEVISEYYKVNLLELFP
jgi:hypothetical protein